jgi:hypothetical protein
MFGAAPAPSQPPRSAPPQGVGPADDYLSRLAGAGRSPVQQTPLHPPPPAPPASLHTPPQASGPSEFTRVISAMPGPAASGQPTPLPPPRAPTPAQPAPAPTSGRWLAIGIGAVVVAAILFVVLIVVTGG